MPGTGNPVASDRPIRPQDATPSGWRGAAVMRFSVWAPRPERVELAIGGDRLPMVRHDDGWWHATADALPTGTDYGYVLDGDGPLPDPRSRWQPDGVDGPSRTFDPAEVVWTDGDWHGFHLPSAVLYELHVGTFSPEGTFDGAIAHLDHLVDLGITAVEVMPINQFPGTHGWGYDGVGLFAAHSPYGGPAGFARLVDACHARGLGVVLDVVYNHLGPYGNVLGRYGPYFTDHYRTPWGDAVNFDGADSDEVRRFVLDDVAWWLRDLHVDGLRLDAVHAIVDASATHLLEAVAVEVADLAAEVGRPLWLIAESDLNDPRLVRSRQAGGYGLDATWNDELHHALHVVLTGERDGYYGDYGGLADVAKALTDVYVHDGTWVPSRRRHHGRPVGDLPGSCFVGSLQNHDQIGNRARGDRLTDTISTDAAKVGAALLLTGTHVPLLFQGEEWGASTPFPYVADHPDPDLADAVRRGRRAEFAAFGWAPEDIPDPMDPATAASAVLAWHELDDAPHAELLEWYRQLIALRRSTPELVDGRRDRTWCEVDEAARTLVVHRGRVTVAANLGDGPATLEAAANGADLDVLALSRPDIAVDGTALTLPAWSVAVVASTGAAAR